MESVNLNIAYQVRAALLEDYEIAMSLKGLSETEIFLFFRNNQLQKFHFNDISYNLAQW